MPGASFGEAGFLRFSQAASLVADSKRNGSSKKGPVSTLIKQKKSDFKVWGPAFTASALQIFSGVRAFWTVWKAHDTRGSVRLPHSNLSGTALGGL